MVIVKWALLFGILVAITITDLKRHEIENEPILLGFGFMTLLFVSGTADISLLDGIVGFFIGGIAFLILAFLGMGGGDIKLMAMVGYFVGWYKVILIMELAMGIGGVFAVVLWLARRRKLKDHIAFGPFIAAATVIMVIYGEQIINSLFTTSL